MCVVAVSCLPPPIQRKRPERTISVSAGRSVVSPRPQTKRGRTTTVSRSAPRTISSAFAFEDEYRTGESGLSGAVSSTFTNGCPPISAASVLTWTSRRTPPALQAATTFRVPCTLTRSKSAGSPKSSTFAAAWKAISQPSTWRSSRSPITGSAPSSRARSAARSERASARTSHPSRRRRSISAPPTNPDPPVTNARVTSALVARPGPERVAHRDGAGDLGLVAERVRVAVLVGEHRLGADAAHLSGAAQVLVDDAGTAAALGDRGHDERLAGAGVAAGEHTFDLRAVDGRPDVPAPVQVEPELLDGALVLRVAEADRDQDELGALLEFAARHGVEVARGGALHAPPHHAGDTAVHPAQRGDLRAEAAVAALVERVRAGRALGRQRPGRARRPPARGQRRVDVEQEHVLGALAKRVRDAVHARVATSHHDDALALGADHLAGRGLAEGASLHRGHGAVSLVEVVHRVMDARELAAGNLQIAMDAGADRNDHGVVLPGELVRGDVAAHVHVAAELDALVLEELHAPVDDPFLELGVGHAEAEQPAGRLVALVDRDRVAELVQLVCHGEARRPGADHGDPPVASGLRRLRRDPALLEPARDDGQLDLLDRDGVVVDVEDAGGLAWRGADQPRELGEVVRGVELHERVAPTVPVDEVVPVRDQVAERAALVTEGDPAVHAAGALVAQGAVVGQLEVLAVVVHALFGIALLEADPLEAEECAELAHAGLDRTSGRVPGGGGRPRRRGGHLGLALGSELLGERALVVVRHDLDDLVERGL